MPDCTCTHSVRACTHTHVLTVVPCMMPISHVHKSWGSHHVWTLHYNTFITAPPPPSRCALLCRHLSGHKNVVQLKGTHEDKSYIHMVMEVRNYACCICAPQLLRVRI